jgi:tRNA A-37 threonylcarbamoyl transferase component Bud32
MAEHLTAVIDQAVARLAGEPMLPFDGGREVATRVLSVVTRPFSYVARVERETDTARSRVIVKVPRLKPGKADQRVSRLKLEIAAAEAIALTLKGQAALSVPDVVAFFPEIPALVWGEVAGETLEAMTTRLARGRPAAAALARLEQACHGAGRWLRVLQDGTAVEGRTFSLEEMAEYVDVRLRRIGEIGPRGLDVYWRTRVKRVFTQAHLPADALRLTSVHGDFSLSNIMYDGARVVAIDFSRFGIGSSYHDVTRLYHQLGLLLHKPWFLPSTVARLRRALLHGFDPSLRADEPIFRLFLIQHLLCHWLGLLKTSPRASWQVRGFNRWVGFRHRRELASLVDALHKDPRLLGS